MIYKRIFTGLALLVTGAVLGFVFSRISSWPERPAGMSQSGQHGNHAQANQTAPAKPGESKVLYWYDPMYPATHFDKPGKSPFMDMDLVPRYAEDTESLGIRIDPAQVQNLAVRTQKVERGRLVFARDIPANIAFNDYQFSHIQPRAEGFVENTYALAVGDTVTAGAPLADITVPGWAADQSEYLLLKSQQASAQLVRGVRERMRLTGMPEEMLKAVDSSGSVQTRMTIPAPIDGVITDFDVYLGMNVDKGMTIATIRGRSPVWVTADVPERDIHLVEGSKRIRITVPAWPDLAFYAESFILLPKADQETRTVQLRLVLENPEGKLRPGLTATIRLRGTDEEALLVPTQSIIDVGSEQRVITRAADGSFVPKTVQVLRSSREKTSIASGLEEGDEIVVSGIFLIDSEANLSGALERMRHDSGATLQDMEAAQ
jgi:Cu(I)/Ag(I) efflux system membrane fusion protein